MEIIPAWLIEELEKLKKQQRIKSDERRLRIEIDERLPQIEKAVEEPETVITIPLR